VPRDVDGVPATTATPGRGDEMWLAPREADHLQPDEGEDLVEIDAERAHADFDKVLAANPIPAAGPEAVWRRTEHRDLLGREIATLDLGPEAGETIAIDALDDLQRQDPGEVPLLEVVGRTGIPEGTTVAYAFNGTVAALTEVEPPYGDPKRNMAVALVPPRLLVEGDSELAAYVVDGPPGKEVLRRLAVEARESGS
jgi:hypothetical protein